VDGDRAGVEVAVAVSGADGSEHPARMRAVATAATDREQRVAAMRRR
jgi:hypothetical protein